MFGDAVDVDMVPISSHEVANILGVIFEAATDDPE